MRRTLSLNLLVSLSLVIAAESAAQPKPPATEDSPIVTEAWMKDGILSFDFPVTMLVLETRREQITTLDGRVVTVEVVVKVPALVKYPTVLDTKRTEVKTREGKAIPIEDWAAKLKEKTKVIVCPSGKPVRDEILKANKDVELIVLQKPAK